MQVFVDQHSQSKKNKKILHNYFLPVIVIAITAITITVDLLSLQIDGDFFFTRLLPPHPI